MMAFCLASSALARRCTTSRLSTTTSCLLPLLKHQPSSLDIIQIRRAPPLGRLAARTAFASRGFCAGPTTPDEGQGAACDESGSSEDGEVISSGVRVYRRERDEHQRTFRWGIGSSFRSRPENRFQPVHLPHHMETVVRNDYYESENPNIVWDELNESWEVYWYENNKLTARPFPVKKWGIERAKVEAYAWYEHLGEEGRLKEKTVVEAPEPGVFYDTRMQGFVSLIWKNGRPESRIFSATKYGLDGARSLAVAKKADPVNGVLPAHRRRRTPFVIRRKPAQA